MFNFLRFKKKVDNYRSTVLVDQSNSVAAGDIVGGDKVVVAKAAPKSVASVSYVPEKPKKKTSYPSTKKASAKVESRGYSSSRDDDYTPVAVYVPDTTDYTPSYTAPEPTYSAGGGDFGGGGSSSSWDSGSSSSSSSYDSGSSSSYSDSSSSSSYSSD